MAPDRFRQFLIFIMLSLTALAAVPALAQTGTFASDGFGPYFSDTLTTDNPDPVDFSSMTSGVWNGGSATTLIINGLGLNAPIYTEKYPFYYTDANLSQATVTLQDAVTGNDIFSLSGPIHYGLVTSDVGIDYLTLTGTLKNSSGGQESFEFLKNYDQGFVTAQFGPAAVPEASSGTGLGILLGLGFAGLAWRARRHRSR